MTWCLDGSLGSPGPSLRKSLSAFSSFHGALKHILGQESRYFVDVDHRALLGCVAHDPLWFRWPLISSVPNPASRFYSLPELLLGTLLQAHLTKSSSAFLGYRLWALLCCCPMSQEVTMVIWSYRYSRDLSPSTLWQNLFLGTIIQNPDQIPIDDQRATSFFSLRHQVWSLFAPLIPKAGWDCEALSPGEGGFVWVCSNLCQILAHRALAERRNIYI